MVWIFYLSLIFKLVFLANFRRSKVCFLLCFCFSQLKYTSFQIYIFQDLIRLLCVSLQNKKQELYQSLHNLELPQCKGLQVNLSFIDYFLHIRENLKKIFLFNVQVVYLHQVYFYTVRKVWYISSNLNSKLFRFHSAHPNLHTHLELKNY